jgi:PPM family protein phosphatase
MGTTVTAAVVGDDRVAIGHVGDSRAYRIRDRGLEQLTQDHSLVADLMRSGRLTPEEADTHPQRSVITRALGTDPEVDVDTLSLEAEPGDVFLLCSDGLTSMVDDDEILRVVRESPKLEAAGRALVKAANRRGGDDNVTVVLFRVEEAALDETAPLGTGGGDDTEDLEDTLTGLEPVAAAPAPEGAPAERAAEDAAAEDAARTDADVPAPAAAPARGAPRRPSWRRRVLLGLLALVLVAALVVAALYGLANAHFVGAESDGRVAVYQGLPYDLGRGVSLYRARYVSALHAAQLSQAERTELFDHDLRSYGAARGRLAPLEAEAVP